MGVKVGRKGKVALGTDKVAEISYWSWSGVENELLESGEFEDETTTYEYGIQNGGKFTIRGHFDSSDAAGQATLEAAGLNKTKVTDARFYIDENNYWTPDADSDLLVEKCRAMEFEKAGIGTIEMVLQVSGTMELTAD